MTSKITRRDFAKAAGAAAAFVSASAAEAGAQAKVASGAAGSSPDERAHATEAQMTDDERFSLIISLIGPSPRSACRATSASPKASP